MTRSGFQKGLLNKLTSIQNIRLRELILLRFINGTWSSSIPTLLFGPGEKILGDEII